MENHIYHQFYVESALLSVSGEIEAIRSLTIYNHLNKIVASRSWEGGSVDFSALPDGLYKTDFFNNSGEVIFSVKIFKESTQNFF